MEIVSINYWNLIKIVKPIFEKIAILCFGAHLKGLFFFGAGIFIFTGHLTMMDTLINTDYE
jgi:hypothetical protein